MSPPLIGTKLRLKPCPARPRLSRRPTTFPSSSAVKRKSHNALPCSNPPVGCDKKTRKIFHEAPHSHREPLFLCSNPHISSSNPPCHSAPYSRNFPHKPRFSCPYPRNPLKAIKKRGSAASPLLCYSNLPFCSRKSKDKTARGKRGVWMSYQIPTRDKNTGAKLFLTNN